MNAAAKQSKYAMVAGLAALSMVGACQSRSDASLPGKSEADASAGTKTTSPALLAFLDKTRKNLKFVEGGTFEMGDFGPKHSPEGLYYSSNPDNKPLHKVTLDNFSMAAIKITYEDHDAYAEATGKPKVGMDDFTKDERHPRVAASLTWHQAREYCQWLGKQLQLPMDIPTEAQWEYAARNKGQFWVFGTDNGKVEVGRNIWRYSQRYAYAKKYGLSDTVPSLPLGYLPANPLGLYDMMTDGLEWVLDWYTPDYYAKSPERNPQGPASGTFKVLRSSESGDGENLSMGDGMSIRRSKRMPNPGDEDLYAKFPNPGYGTTSRCVVNSAQPVSAVTP